MTHEEQLRGREFISEKVDVGRGTLYDRVCGMCDNADSDGERIPCINGDKVRSYFRIQGQDPPPETLDGKKIGNFCPFYTPWNPWAE